MRFRGLATGSFSNRESDDLVDGDVVPSLGLSLSGSLRKVREAVWFSLIIQECIPMIHGDFLSTKTFAQNHSSSRQMSQSRRIIGIRTSLTADRSDLKSGADLSYRVEERELMERDYLQYLECPTFGCSEVETLVDEYIDRELPEAVHLRFDEHLGCCEECRALVFDIQKIVEIARTLDKEPLPLGLSERLRQRLADEVGYEPPPSRKLQIVK